MNMSYYEYLKGSVPRKLRPR